MYFALTGSVPCPPMQYEQGNAVNVRLQFCAMLIGLPLWRGAMTSSGKIKLRMNYYVYEDNKNKKVRVHAGICTYCREGKGMPKWTQAENKIWHGPYDTVATAQTVANTLQEKDRRTCTHCLDGKRF